MARRKKANEVPFIPLAGPTTFYSTGTANGDLSTALIVPSDATFGRSVISCITNGTGTDNPTIAWFSSSAGGGTQLTTGHRDSSGTLYDLDAGAGIVYTADALINFYVSEGGRLFLNITFGGGSHTVAGTFGLAFFLVL